VIRKIKIKITITYISYILELPIYRALATPIAGKDAEPKEHSFTANRTAKWSSHFY
jgi:hypothetical protein